MNWLDSAREGTVAHVDRNHITMREDKMYPGSNNSFRRFGWSKGALCRFVLLRDSRLKSSPSIFLFLEIFGCFVKQKLMGHSRQKREVKCLKRME
jgi:hypothetical protein